MARILNIAHRGFSSEYPENTLLAFEQAMNAGADGFECDLRLTADGRVVVFHDDNLKRLCGVSGSIEQMTWPEVQKLRVKLSGKPEDKIPCLEDLLTQFSTTRMNLEIKHSAREAAVVESTLRVLTKIRPQGSILFSSFSVEVLRCLQVMDAHRSLGKLGVLIESRHLDKLPMISKNFKPDTWNVPKQVLKQPWAERWKGQEVPPLWVWTVDEPDEWRACTVSKLPIEAIITNKPAALSDFLRAL